MKHKNFKINAIVIAFFGIALPLYSEIQSPSEGFLSNKISQIASNAKNKLYSTRLFAGYHSSPEEKKIAYEKIRTLLFERDELQDRLKLGFKDKEDMNIIEQRIIEIDKEIYEQKVIVGQEWTNTRKFVVWGIGGAVAMGVGSELLRRSMIDNDKKKPSIPPTGTKVSANVLRPGDTVGQNGYVIELVFESSFNPDPKKSYQWYYHDSSQADLVSIIPFASDPCKLVLNPGDILHKTYYIYDTNSIHENAQNDTFPYVDLAMVNIFSMGDIALASSSQEKFGKIKSVILK